MTSIRLEVYVLLLSVQGIYILLQHLHFTTSPRTVSPNLTLTAPNIELVIPGQSDSGEHFHHQCGHQSGGVFRPLLRRAIAREHINSVLLCYQREMCQ